MGRPEKPLSVGDRVYHVGQLWAYSLPGGTAEITGVLGPYKDGTYEYKLLTPEDFSRRPGPDNPMTRESQWASRATRTAAS